MEGEERLVGDRNWSAGVRRGGEIEVSMRLLSPFIFVAVAFGGKSKFVLESYGVFALHPSRTISV